MVTRCVRDELQKKQDIFYRDYHRAHQSLGQIIAGVIVEVGEILLHDVIHDVVYASLHLVLRYAHRELRVENREFWHHTTVDMMNFTSLSYFSRYCTKHLGLSPSEYRLSLQPK